MECADWDVEDEGLKDLLSEEADDEDLGGDSFLDEESPFCFEESDSEAEEGFFMEDVSSSVVTAFEDFEEAPAVLAELESFVVSDFDEFF